MADPKPPPRRGSMPTRPTAPTNNFRNAAISRTPRGTSAARSLLPPRNDARGTVPVLDHRNTPSPWANNDTTEPVDDFEEVGAGRQLSAAERARTVVFNGRTATLSTLLGESSAPIGFVCNYSVLEDGSPVVAVHSSVGRVALVEHDIAASLTIAETPLTAMASLLPSAVTAVGRLRAVDRRQLHDLRNIHVRTHNSDDIALLRGDSKLFVLDTVAMLVSGAGDAISRVPFDDYSAAEVDPLSTIAPGLAAHLSGNENGSLLLLARAFGSLANASSAQLVAIDRFGIDLSARVGDVREPVRLAFQQPVSSADDVRRELNVMVRGARFKLGTG